MNKLELVKMEILRRKINESFKKSKHKSAIITAEVKGSKFFWKVVREEKGFIITEVETKKSKFIFEQGNEPTVPGGSPVEYDPMGAGETTAQQKSRRKARAKVLLPPKPTSGTAAGPTTLNPVVPGAGTARRDTQAQQFKQQFAGQFNDWTPAGIGNKFEKELLRTQSFKQAALKMPPEEFARSFQSFGAKTPSQLTPDVLKKAKDYFARHNPNIARMREGVALQEASPEFQSFSRDFQTAMTSVSSGDRNMASSLADTRKRMESGAGRIKDPFEAVQVSAMLGAVTAASDSTTKLSDPSKTGATFQGEGKKIVLKMMREAGKEEKPERDNAVEEPVNKQAGLETNPVAPDDPEQTATKEPEALVGDALSSKSLGTVSFSVKPGVSTLTLEILGHANPSILEHRRDGTITWSHRGQIKMFKPSGSVESPKPEKKKR